MKENETYYQIKREEWSQYEGAHPFTMTREELAHLTSLNDRISLQDVQEVYVPMLDYFDLYFKNILNYARRNSNFFIKQRKQCRLLSGCLGVWPLGRVRLPA